MKNPIKSIFAIFAGASCCFLVSCSGSADIAAMSPANAPAVSRTGAPVRAMVTGGAARSAILTTVTNEDFKEALETSLVKSGMFKSAGSGGYQLDAFITSVDQPMVGISMRVGMEVNYPKKENGCVG